MAMKRQLAGMRLVVCIGSRCRRRGSGRLLKAAAARKPVQVVRSGCLGLCMRAPVVISYPDGIWYGAMTVPEVAQVGVPGSNLEEHVVFRMGEGPRPPKFRCEALPELGSDLH